jgi:hypothetical protein
MPRSEDVFHQALMRAVSRSGSDNSPCQVNRTRSLDDRLLVDRRRAATILGVSVMTIIRLERSGSLPRVRLNKSVPHPKAYYRLGDVLALVAA